MTPDSRISSRSRYLPGALAHPGEDRDALVEFATRRIISMMRTSYRRRTPKRPILPPDVRGEEVDDLDAGSNMVACGSSWSKAGALRWISSSLNRSDVVGVERLADDVKDVSEHGVTTGTVIPRPVWRTTAPRTSPSVGFMHTQRTRPSPICWATSPVTVIVSPSMMMSTSTAWLISGNESRELHVHDRSGDRDDAPRLEGGLFWSDGHLFSLSERSASAPPTISMISVVIES